MKQQEVIKFGRPKHDTKLFHNYKENIWLINVQLIISKRCFVLFRNVVSEFLIFQIYLS